MAERVFINDLNPITDIQDGAKILVDQNGYKKMFYSDFVVDIAGTLKSEYSTGWNADLVGGTPLSVETAQQSEVLIYNSSSSQFENRRIDSSDIDWSGIDVNENKFLQVASSGQVVQDFISIPSLRIDNDTSSGYFLRVNSGNRQIEAVPFNPSEFTINAQSLQGNTVSDLDSRYLRTTNNLQDLTNTSTARTSLSVLSESESDARYLRNSSNLSDISSASTAFNNIKQSSSTSYAGVIEIATNPEVQDGIRSDVAVVPSSLKDNYYNKSISDGRFLNAANNLSDVNNSTAVRQNLNVYSSSETDSRYLQKALNLSDIGSKSIARDNLDVYDKGYVNTFTLNPLNNLSDVDNVSAARNNLGVYSTTEADNTFLKKSEQIPVGMTYMQFPGRTSPGNLFGGTWSAIFDNEGVFFRTPGSGATFFGGGIQGDAIRNITGDTEWAVDWNNSNSIGIVRYNGAIYGSSAQPTAHITDSNGAEQSGRRRRMYFDASRVVPTSTEVRPRNRTVRVWVKISN